MTRESKVAIVLTAGSLALLALVWGLGRVSLTAGNSAADLVAQDKLEDLEGKYRQAVVRIEAFEAARNERRHLDEPLAALTEELRGMGEERPGGGSLHKYINEIILHNRMKFLRAMQRFHDILDA